MDDDREMLERCIKGYEESLDRLQKQYQAAQQNGNQKYVDRFRQEIEETKEHLRKAGEALLRMGQG